MFNFNTLWDLYEFKLFLLLITSGIAIVIGNKLYEAKQKNKKLRTDTENDT